MIPDSSISVGIKVVYINDNFHPAVCEWFNQAPRRGRVDTVCATFMGTQYGTTRRTPSCRLEELPPLLPGFGGFSCWHFRPLQAISQETAIRNTCLQPACGGGAGQVSTPFRRGKRALSSGKRPFLATRTGAFQRMKSIRDSSVSNHDDKPLSA